MSNVIALCFVIVGGLGLVEAIFNKKSQLLDYWLSLMAVGIGVSIYLFYGF